MPQTAHSRYNTLILLKIREEVVKKLREECGGGCSWGAGWGWGEDQAWLFFLEAFQHYLMLNYTCALLCNAIYFKNKK